MANENLFLVKLNVKQSLFTNNALVFYKPRTLARCGVGGSVTGGNARARARRT